ncbi:hypothetical protein LguiA_002068 [Lonicera macranthoides]
MAISPTSEYRGVAAAISQPASMKDIATLEHHMYSLRLYNCQGPSIQFRDPIEDQDIVEAVYRWDDRPFDQIFRTGFRPRDCGSTNVQDYYNLERHVNGGGAPIDASPVDGSVFVSTTRSPAWKPWVTTDMILYRYEIFAPGGIDTVLTLREHNDYPNQQEIAFVGGIDRQYIRSTRPYQFSAPEPPSRYSISRPYENRIVRNGYFDPNPSVDPDTDLEVPTTQAFMDRLRNVNCPKREDLGYMVNVVFAANNTTNVQKREIGTIASLTEEPYVDPCCNVGHYIDCAFNFNMQEKAFIFTTDQCLLINYAPDTTDDVIKGPMSIGDFFPSLINTIFATGIDAAFTSSEENKVYIFRSNIYILLNFVSGDIIGGPKKITDGFYSLKDTIFEHGIDAAFASSQDDEAYIFKGDQYALINFAPGKTNDYLLNPPKKITLGFPSLKGTIFEDGLDAAFSAKEINEAYIFKGNSYAHINYAPGTTDDCIINSVTSFHSLNGIIPRYPCGC